MDPARRALVIYEVEWTSESESESMFHMHASCASTRPHERANTQPPKPTANHKTKLLTRSHFNPTNNPNLHLPAQIQRSPPLIRPHDDDIILKLIAPAPVHYCEEGLHFEEGSFLGGSERAGDGGGRGLGEGGEV